MPARTGKGRRGKGRRFELMAIKDMWGGTPPWKPHASPDQGFRPSPPFDTWHLEMKNQEHLNIWDALRQAKEDARTPPNSGKPYAVIFTRARAGWYVALPYELWKDLVKDI